MKKYISTIIFVIILLVVVFFDSFKAWFRWSFFLLDFVPSPIYIYNINFLQIPIFNIIYNFLIYMFWYILLTKIYIYWLALFTIFIWYKIWDYFVKKYEIVDDFYQNIIYIASIAITVINPFFTERMATQPWVWNGILFIAVWRYILVKNFSNKLNYKTIIYIWLFWWFGISAMNHGIYIVILLTTIYILATKFKNPISIIYISIIVWLLNLNRIIWWFLWNNEIIKWATSFNAANIAVFATQPLGNLPVEASTALWYWFWAEQWQRLVTAQTANPFRYIFGAIVLLIWFYGIYIEIKNTKEKSQNIILIYTSIVLLIITLWLWIWISNHFWSGIIQWLYDNLPGYRGFREPHKRIGIYIMILIPFVINWFANISKKIDSTIVLTVFIFLLYGRAPGVINMSWLYKLTDYPQDYANSRIYISEKYPDSKWILLPWHSYMSCNRTSNVISITATDFYKPNIVKTADNIEIWNLYTNSNSKVSDQIDKYIHNWQDNKIIKSLWYSGFVMRKWCSDTGSFARVNDTKKFENIYSWQDVWIYIIK